jgi:YwiC-like protein
MLGLKTDMTDMGAPSLGRPIVPKEHGAWAVLYGAFLAGVGVAGRLTVPVMLLLGAVTLLAFANGPLTLILRPVKAEASRDGRRRAAVWLLAYAVGAVACLTPLLAVYRMGFLLPFGMAAACVFVLRAFFVREGDDRSLPGELVGTAGLTLVGPAAQAVALRGVQPGSAVLWLLLFLYFASGVFYVRMRIRVMIAERKGATAASGPARGWCLFYHAFLLFLVPALAAGDLIPWGVLLAFVPAIWRAACGLRRRDAALNLRRLGWSEVGLTLAFVLVLIVAL